MLTQLPLTALWFVICKRWKNFVFHIELGSSGPKLHTCSVLLQGSANLHIQNLPLSLYCLPIFFHHIFSSLCLTVKLPLSHLLWCYILSALFMKIFVSFDSN